jgi:outer membrane protein
MRPFVLLSLAGSAGLITLVPAPALALQPVEVFLEHAKTWNPQNRAAHATTAQRDAELDVSTGQLLPNLSATGTYTRNQYQVDTSALVGGSAATAGFSIPNTIIQPQDQFDANFTLNIPIINVYNWDRRSAAKATLAGAHASEANAEFSIERSVVRQYYVLLGEEAVVLSATKNLDLARQNLKHARDKREAGTGPELDVQRAVADQAKAEQNLTAAQLAVINTRRDLYTLTGINAEPAAAFPEDDLHEEEPLERWTGQPIDIPPVKAAQANRVTAEESARAVKAVVLPTVFGSAQEKLTNATAFVGGHTDVYLLQLGIQWKVDATVFAQNRAQDAAVAAARALEDQSRQEAEDAVFKDWQQVRADIDSAHSARAQVAATKLAASLAEDRYESGVATQLDVLQARQEAFAADIARIQADADLAYARIALRLDAGKLSKGTR